MARSARRKPIHDYENHASELLTRIYDEILRQTCVVFVGAGSTTEGHRAHKETYYEHIRKLANLPNSNLSFPELMQYFCERMDGGHHNRLIGEALSRIEEFCVRDSEDHYFATMFTNALAQIPYFNRFVTTNWDPFLERSLDVLVPMVEDRDLAFWDDHKKQVLKIHGCITRPYSIVATQTDYDRCTTRNRLIFNKLKDLMATKTFLFAGYSMRDADFRKIWDSISGSLGHFAKLAYALDPNASEEQISFWKEKGVAVFKSTDLAFIGSLKKRLEQEDLIPNDSLLAFLHRERQRIVSIHIKMGQTSDGRFASAMYQDGLLHELDSVFSSSALGTMKKEDYEREYGEKRRWLNDAWRAQDEIEICYRSGRVEVLERFNNRDKSKIPAFFHPYKLRPTANLIRGKPF